MQYVTIKPYEPVPHYDPLTGELVSVWEVVDIRRGKIRIRRSHDLGEARKMMAEAERNKEKRRD